MSETIRVTVARRVEEATGIIALELVDAQGHDLPAFEAGAHIEVCLASGLRRHYSLCGMPSDRTRYRVAVLLEKNSRGGSAWIHEHCREGETLSISLPRNNFKLEEQAAHSLLIGGGIGITPLLAMAWRLHEAGQSFELHYCVRDRACAAFLPLLATDPFAERCRLYVDNEGERIDLNALLRHAPGQAHVYVCGPNGFMEAVCDAVVAHEWPARHIHREYFSADAQVEGQAFTVYAQRSGKSVTVSENSSIAQALLACGIEVPLSCEQGVCGTCLTRVLEGVPDHRDYYLDDEEKAANDRMAVCCSRSLGPFLRLDI
ncbi:PDR/VanB family oxidoreductase [Pseudomonas entomophila]|uniref:PDR/VanB family oxidoreductase n=1 Tax=Pseudomonas entomophila TaxID=312306 RepID=UPI0023D86EBA|nr:PDR/VanB family oxidoreductase [Pseudomonas entomophila]MDF0729571.1 PDR/VanB family oxidoreductase [Pseudomonas entomophila]